MTTDQSILKEDLVTLLTYVSGLVTEPVDGEEMNDFDPIYRKSDLYSIKKSVQTAMDMRRSYNKQE